MTRLKKLTALLVSAALALSLLAGCGGSKALSQVIADLLSGMYNNVTVEVDPDLTAALKKAAAAGSTQEEVLAALVEELNLSGVRLTLRQLQEGRQGDRGVELVFQSGADPDAAARSAVNGWASAFGALPDDGSYTARVAMIEAEGGYYIAVDVEVLKAGTPDKDDPEPKPDYTYDEASNTYTVYTAAGLQEWAKAARAAIDNGETAVNCTLGSNITLTGTNNWIPIGNELNKPYTGTFKGDGHKISGLNVKGDYSFAGLFGQIGPNGTVQDLTLDSPTVSSDDFDSAGAVVGRNEGGIIDNCHVTGSGTITGSVYAGGVVGSNNGGTVTACSAIGNVNVTATDNGKVPYAGGVAGHNKGTITACYAGGSVTAIGTSCGAGGVVGWNITGSTVTACYATGKVESDYAAGGVVGWNISTVTACYWSGTVNGSTQSNQGIGSGSGDTKKVTSDGDTDGDNNTTTWADAVDSMNNNITTGWWYVPNGDSAPTKFTQTKPVPSTTP